MDVDWHHELLDQMQVYWDHMLWPRLEGLTDHEYLWESAQPAWTVHPRDDGTATIDWALEVPDPAPVTTIAWRLCHIGGLCFWMRWNHHFDDGTWTPNRNDWPTTADAGLDYLQEGYQRWRDAVREHAEKLAEPAGPAEGPYAERAFATLVLHLTREMCHHGGEIGLLRDLYRRRMDDREGR